MERSTLARCAALDSPFLCSISYAFSAGYWLVLAMPLYAGGSLQTIIAERGEWGLNEVDLRWVAANMTLGLGALHSLGLIHRDIKPDNVMVRRDGYLSLADYGLVADLGTPITDKHGSKSYWAPEVIREEQQGPYSDWWSVGVTLAQCANGRHPFMRRWVRAVKGRVDAPTPPWDETRVDCKIDQFKAPNESDLSEEDLNYNTLYKPIEFKSAGAHVHLIKSMLTHDVRDRLSGVGRVKACDCFAPALEFGIRLLTY